MLKMQESSTARGKGGNNMTVYVPRNEIPIDCFWCPMLADEDCVLQSKEANGNFDSYSEMYKNCPIIPLGEVRK